jgi:hypothetical protein
MDYLHLRGSGYQQLESSCCRDEDSDVPSGRQGLVVEGHLGSWAMVQEGSLGPKTLVRLAR